MTRTDREIRYHYLDYVLTSMLTCSVFTARSSNLPVAPTRPRQIKLFVFNRLRILLPFFVPTVKRISFVLIFLRTLFTNRRARISSKFFNFTIFRTLGKMMGGWHPSFPFSILELASFPWSFAATLFDLEACNRV